MPVLPVHRAWHEHFVVSDWPRMSWYDVVKSFCALEDGQARESLTLDDVDACDLQRPADPDVSKPKLKALVDLDCPYVRYKL